jgi:hypothetical protein
MMIATIASLEAITPKMIVPVKSGLGWEEEEEEEVAAADVALKAAVSNLG